MVSVDADAAEAVRLGGRVDEATGTGSQARIREVSIVLGGGEGGGRSGLGLQRWLCSQGRWSIAKCEYPPPVDKKLVQPVFTLHDLLPHEPSAVGGTRSRESRSRET